jgi:ABC-type branched-subunit amino acid transport system ATPase component
VKLRVLALSGFVAATAGVFFAADWQSVTPTYFGADASIALLAIPVVGGLGSLGGAVAAAALLYLATFFLGPHVEGLLGSVGQNAGFLLFIAGIGVIITMMQFPNGIAGAVQEAWQKYLNKKATRMTAATVEGAAASREERAALGGEGDVPTPGTAIERAAAGINFATIERHQLDAQEGKDADGESAPQVQPLVVADVRVHFGGIAALQDAAIEVRAGEIVGLIGPNGAGKTTLMNVVSGVLRPDQGSVQLFGHEVARRPPDIRARYGLARSFQDASLFAGLTVTETIQVATSQQVKPHVLTAMVGAPWVRSAERSNRRRATEIVEAFGLTQWADALTSELSTGMRRICDLAAQVATEPRLLLLDEPTAGVAQREAEAFAPLVRRIRDDLDCAILVIEHDMPMLMGLCDRVYAMDTGSVIAEGTPAEVREDPAVITSYLGTNTAAISRSGQVVSI